MDSVDIRTDMPELIREVQEHLRTLAFADARIPLVAVDGVYGKETTEAVRRFQQLYGLPVTGNVDPTTWDYIYLAYREVNRGNRQPKAPVAFPSSNYVLRPGDSGRLVSFLELMLNAIAERYDNVLAVSLSGNYAEPTAAQVREIQRLAGLPQNGVVDLDTWDAIVSVYNSLFDNDTLNKEP